MKIKTPSLYKKYHLDRDDERIGLFTILKDRYNIQNALYPGSFVHFAPSFVFSNVTYVDSYKKAKPVFDDPDTIAYIHSRKTYNQDSCVNFIHADFTKKLDLSEQSFDLLISQYAGLISHYCKLYLKTGGILVANNSHGDASMAFLDPEYELVGVINKNSSRYSFSNKNLDNYFIPKKRDQVTKEELLRTLKGIGYTKSAGNYVFKKIV